ncbi:MAG: ATP synthase subunit I [Steroidobacteraceae bacterium]
MALTIDLASARRLAFGVVLGQAAVTLAVALACVPFAGGKAALSALLGGGIGTLTSLAMVALAFGGWASGSAERMLVAFYAGELAKFVLVVALFAAVLWWLKPSPGALLGAYGATFLVYWLVLAGALPVFGRGRALHGQRSWGAGAAP